MRSIRVGDRSKFADLRTGISEPFSDPPTLPFEAPVTTAISAGEIVANGHIFTPNAP